MWLKGLPYKQIYNLVGWGCGIVFSVVLNTTVIKNGKFSTIILSDDKRVRYVTNACHFKDFKGLKKIEKFQ